MKTNILNKIVIFTLLLVINISVTGCNKSNEPQKEKTKQTKKVVHRPYIIHYATKEVVGSEDYADKKQWSEPRIQFVQDHPKKTRRFGLNQAIWSMKLDATDIKLAYTMEQINNDHGGKYNIGASIHHLPVRSPDGKYVIISSVKNNAILVNLKTKKYKLIDKGRGQPDFIWTNDSQNVIFYKDQILKNYNIKNKKLSIISDKIFSRDLYLLPDQKTFLSVMSDEVVYYDKKTTKIIKKIKLPVENLVSSILSNDGKYLYYRDRHSSGILDLSLNKTIIHDDSDFKRDKQFLGSNGFFMPNTSYYYFARVNTLIRYNLSTNKYEKLFDLDFSPRFMTLLLNKDK